MSKPNGLTESERKKLCDLVRLTDFRICFALGSRISTSNKLSLDKTYCTLTVLRQKHFESIHRFEESFDFIRGWLEAKKLPTC